jgi:hypothetical protein
MLVVQNDRAKPLKPASQRLVIIAAKGYNPAFGLDLPPALCWDAWEWRFRTT